MINVIFYIDKLYSVFVMFIIYGPEYADISVYAKKHPFVKFMHIESYVIFVVTYTVCEVLEYDGGCYGVRQWICVEFMNVI